MPRRTRKSLVGKWIENAERRERELAYQLLLGELCHQWCEQAHREAGLVQPEPAEPCSDRPAA